MRTTSSRCTRTRAVAARPIRSRRLRRWPTQRMRRWRPAPWRPPPVTGTASAVRLQSRTREPELGPGRGVTMKIEYLHASKYGNGAMVAEEFGRQMAAKGVTVEVHHIQEVNPKELPPADLYLFSSPARSGKPIRAMRRFLKKLALPSGAKYATLSTEVAPHPGRAGRVPRTAGSVPSEEDLARWTRVRPVM